MIVSEVTEILLGKQGKPFPDILMKCDKSRFLYLGITNDYFT